MKNKNKLEEMTRREFLKKFSPKEVVYSLGRFYKEIVKESKRYTVKK